MESEKNNIKEFDGKCAFAVFLGKNDVAGKAEHSLFQDGKEYLFANSQVKFLWKMIPIIKKKAEKNWVKK